MDIQKKIRSNFIEKASSLLKMNSFTDLLASIVKIFSSLVQLIFAAEDYTATTTTYALARWKGELATIQPTNHTVIIRIFDFYLMSGKKRDKI